MDFVNKAMGKEERSTQGTAPAAPQAGGQVQKDDYADKGKPSLLFKGTLPSLFFSFSV